MTQPSRAAIEIVGDASKLGAQLERDAQRAIDNTDLDLTPISKQISDGFKDGLDDLDADFARAQDFLDEFFTSLADMAEETADDVALHFEDGGVRIERTFRRTRRESDGLFDNLTDGARRAGRALNENLLQPAVQGLQRFGRLLGTVGTSLAEFAGMSLNPAGLATAAAYIAAFTLLIPLVIGLAAALADLAGFAALLPGALGVAASAVIVATIAFQGFGDALSAIIEGDPEKIAEAMEKLAPSARKVAEEFERILPAFRRIGDSIQERFFEPLVGILERFGTRTVPRLRNELDTLATTLGRVVGHFGDLANEVETVSTLERLLGSTSRIADLLGVSFANLGRALLNALDASLPTLEELSGRLANAIDSFASFINASIEDGSFQEFLDDAIATLDELLDLGGAVGELLGVLFSGTDDAGRGFLGTLTDLTKRLTEFFKSAEGQDAIADFTELIGFAGFVIGQFVTGIRNLLFAFSLIDDAVQATGQFFSDLWDDIVEIWNGIVETVSGAINSIVVFFQELPDKIAAFVESIPGRIAAFFDMLVDQALNILALGIAAIIVFFTDLPGQIVGALTALWNTITEWFTNIKNTAIEIFNNVVTFFQELPGRISGFLSSLPGRISEFFKQAKDGASNRLTELVNFVKGIPGRILSALGSVGTMLLDSGKRIIQGLIDGISSKLGALREKIASAVQTIRDHLPFSPAKTGPLSGQGSPQIAGAVIAEMIAAGLDSGHGLITDAAARAAGATTSPFGAIGQAGGAPLLSPGGPGAPAGVLTGTQAVVEQQPVFIIQIGDEEIEAFIDRRVDTAVTVEVRRLLAGTRGI